MSVTQAWEEKESEAEQNLRAALRKYQAALKEARDSREPPNNERRASLREKIARINELLAD